MGIIECISGSIIFWGEGDGIKGNWKCIQMLTSAFSCKNGVHNFGSPQLSSRKKKIRKGKKVNSLRIFILLFPPSLLECYQYLEALLTFFDQTGARGICTVKEEGLSTLDSLNRHSILCVFWKEIRDFLSFSGFSQVTPWLWLFKDPFNKYKGATERSVELMH